MMTSFSNTPSTVLYNELKNLLQDERPFLYGSKKRLQSELMLRTEIVINGYHTNSPMGCNQ